MSVVHRLSPYFPLFLLSLRTRVKLAEIGWNFADTKEGIHKTSGQFISIYSLLFFQNSGAYFTTTIIPYKPLYGTLLLGFPVNVFGTNLSFFASFERADPIRSRFERPEVLSRSASYHAHSRAFGALKTRVSKPLAPRAAKLSIYSEENTCPTHVAISFASSSPSRPWL